MADRPLILFAHGAGAPSASPWMREWAERLGSLGAVVPFDYPYMRERRRAPDRLPVLIAAHREALAAARQKHGDRPIVLAGKSMGSRVGCHLAVELSAQPTAELPAPRALVCFGYPLRSPGSGALRDEVLRQLTTPVLFLQGSRDPLCPLADLESVRPRMSAPNELFIVEGGDHSLTFRRKRAAPGERSQADWDREVLAAVNRFLAGAIG